MSEYVSRFLAGAKVVAKATPTWGAAFVAVLTAVNLEVVPLLTDTVGVQVAAGIASAIAAVRAVVRVVSGVTPVLWPEDRGLVD